MLKYICVFLTLFSSITYANSDILISYQSFFSQLPLWNEKTATIHPFGQGCTNQNYKLEVGDNSYFVRLLSPAKNILGLSFANEIELIQLANSLKLAPPILLADAKQGIIIFPFIEGKSVDLRDKEKLNEVMKLVKKLHHSKAHISFQATPEDFISKYLEILQKQNIVLSPLQKQLIANRPRPVLDQLVPCHLDLKGDNILDDGKRLWLIDWEYGGMSDPLLDIAQLTPSENFSDEDTLIALSYYDPHATLEMKQKVEQLRILSNIRIALWCLIMSHFSTLDHPYQQWADELFLEIENALYKINQSQINFND